MSFEASAQGTSTKCAKMTPVVLEDMPHETQNQPQDSLPLTLRLPIEGEPNACKQEAVESVVTAGCTNRMAEMAKPTVVDIDRTAMLGKDLATAACGVDEGNGTEHRDLWLQQTKFFCEETGQCNANTNENVPIAHGVPLKGEWTWCASGKVSDSKGNANAFNGAIEHVV